MLQNYLELLTCYWQDIAEATGTFWHTLY